MAQAFSSQPLDVTSANCVFRGWCGSQGLEVQGAETWLLGRERRTGFPQKQGPVLVLRLVAERACRRPGQVIFKAKLYT